MTAPTIAAIRERHARAEDSSKGAADWLADYALDAHQDRAFLLSLLAEAREAVEPLMSDSAHDGKYRDCDECAAINRAKALAAKLKVTP